MLTSLSEYFQGRRKTLDESFDNLEKVIELIRYLPESVAISGWILGQGPVRNLNHKELIRSIYSDFTVVNDFYATNLKHLVFSRTKDSKHYLNLEYSEKDKISDPFKKYNLQYILKNNCR